MGKDGADATVSISELATALEALSMEGKSKGPKVSSLPSPMQLYQVGLVLYNLHQKDPSSHGSLLDTYHRLLNVLPASYVKGILLRDLTAAYRTVINMGKENEETTLTATQSLCGLYAHSPLTCRQGYSPDLCSSLALAYDFLQTARRTDDYLHDELLRTLSLLLQDGLLQPMQDSKEEEENKMECIMKLVQSLTADHRNSYLGDTLEFQQRIGPSRSFPSMLQSQLEASPQLDYLMRMLDSSAKSIDVTIQFSSKQKEESVASRKVPATATTGQSEIQRRIHQVRNVLPDLGEGYVEAALACYQGDVERTVSVLLEGQADPSSLPPTLQRMDRQLPRRHVETTPNSYALNDEEAKKVTKDRLVAMQRQEEAEAYALTVMNVTNEYDDDYDDQYDGMDGGDLGGGDGESYDVDLETIRTYNRVAREAEKEDKFWEETRNVNRQKGGGQQKFSKPNDDEGAQETNKFRGPDKGKGGRLIGPDGKYMPIKKGGKKGRQQRANQAKSESSNGDKASGETNGLTKIQKRRKNDNKAKVANHHRKERAQKKTGGM